MGSPLPMATAATPHIKAWNCVNPTPERMGIARFWLRTLEVEELTGVEKEVGVGHCGGGCVLMILFNLSLLIYLNFQLFIINPNGFIINMLAL